ncbi:hypothetical protein A9P82_08075 [Arachidicoccus ginsenosidimutans]|uniref:site-specific integrase n=1 Tax=Arachidicoccus sp. BS20 TaxID=1850526 RepID=UPI0007F08A77|nr:site-specific integrase [Arachidicoccus sp. BS20]ANI89252.1 hypothetical protein A9P82_08075 [Arachidicoccus sp. BS20]
MNVRQNLFILFYLKRAKTTRDNKIPIYVRITIDGLSDEISTGCKVFSNDWDNKNKTVKSSAPDAKAINKKIRQITTDIERHFDLMVAKYGIVTPTMVKASYSTPINGEKQRQEKKENLAFGLKIDSIINEYLLYHKKVQKAEKNDNGKEDTIYDLLNEEKKMLIEKIEELAKESKPIFDNKERAKTLLLVIDDFLLNFLQLVTVGQRSANTLEKLIGRKRRYADFMQYRYKKDDFYLTELDYNFISELYNHLIIYYKICANTATKYCQFLKEMMDRAVAKLWVGANVFSIFKCKYEEPEHNWLSMETAIDLIKYKFEDEDLNEIRDIYIFQSFCGLSYQELYNLDASDVIIGIDGDKWIDKNRGKTGVNEPVPLLPICLEILERYGSHPLCQRRRKLLPVPTNQHYNRCLKLIAKERGIQIILRTHRARYFFANEVTYNNGVPLKTIGKMLGQKSIKTTEVYVRANKRNISENMEMVKEKLFNENGSLKDLEKEQAKNITPMWNNGSVNYVSFSYTVKQTSKE